MTASDTSAPLAPRPVLCAGLLVADLFIPPLNRLPAAGELMATGNFLADTGGCAANTVTALAKLGVRATVAGTVGQDIFGDFIIQDLTRKGADASAITRTSDYSTSQTVILPVVGEDRRYIHTFGANNAFSVEDIDRAALAQAKVFCVGGYLILPNLKPTALAALFAEARQHGTRTVLDVVVPAGNTAGDGTDEDGKAAMRALAQVLPHVDYFLPNNEEAQRLTGHRDPHRQAKALLEAGCGTVIITLGAHGTLTMNARTTLEQPAYKVNVVDGSGAGDAFAAGLILGLLESWPLVRTLKFASAMGASACTALGCNAGLFTREQAERFIAQN